MKHRKHQTLRFHSTPESAVNLEITKLAIIETIVSVAIYIGIGVYFETVVHYALAIVVAPFMLLRTEESAEWMLGTFKKNIEITLRPVFPSPRRASIIKMGKLIF